MPIRNGSRAHEHVGPWRTCKHVKQTAVATETLWNIDQFSGSSNWRLAVVWLRSVSNETRVKRPSRLPAGGAASVELSRWEADWSRWPREWNKSQPEFRVISKGQTKCSRLEIVKPLHGLTTQSSFRISAAAWQLCVTWNHFTVFGVFWSWRRIKSAMKRQSAVELLPLDLWFHFLFPRNIAIKCQTFKVDRHCNKQL